MYQYNISNEKPPVFEVCEKKFGIKWENTIFAFNGTIHCAYPDRLTKDIIEHEIVHLKQQEGNHLSWWERYLADDEFRLSQEIQAYRRQYNVLRQYADRNYVVKSVDFWASALSGKEYGYLISKADAIKQITK